MAISTYSELKTAITDWMDRSELSGSAADFIALAEARLNRELITVGVTASLTATVGSASVDISALPVIRPKSLFMTDNGEEYELTPRALGTFTVGDENHFPTIWAIEGNYIKFDYPSDQAYPLRFVYEGRFALSDASPTNDLLTNSPDIYLAASIVWGSVYVRNNADISMFEGLLNAFVAEQKSIIAQKKRSMLTIDPALSRIGRDRYDMDIRV